MAETKIQQMWKISKEQEELFRKSLPEIHNGIDTEELFKLIRGSEYRRGKEDKQKDVLKLIEEEYKCDPQGLYYTLIKKITGETK